jgi:hypothetical protein
MNNKQFEKQLKTDLPDFELTSHKNALKKLLVNSYTPRISERNYLWKGGDYVVKHKIISIGVTGFLVIALLVGWTIFGDNKLSPLPPAQAEAQEIIDRTFDRIIKLTPEEQKELEIRLQADLQSSLEEARNAPDLRIVPEEELHRMTPPPTEGEKPVYGFMAIHQKPMHEGQGLPESEMSAGTRVQVDNHKIMAPEGLTILGYTNPEGRKVFLGIDKDDKPVFKIIKLEGKDMEGLPKEGKVIHFNKRID